MDNLDKEGKYTVNDKIRNGMSDFIGGFADEAMTLSAIADMYNESNYLMDTHTAVAYDVYRKYRENTGDTTPTVIASTASAYKFASSVADALDMSEEKDGFAYVRALNQKSGVEIPDGLKDLEDRAVRHSDVVSRDALEEAVRKSLK